MGKLSAGATEQATFSLVRQFNKGFRSSYWLNRCSVPSQGAVAMSTGKKTQEDQHFLWNGGMERLLGQGIEGGWSSSLNHPGHPGHEQVGRKQKQSWGTKHSRAGLIVFDEAGRQRWAAAHNHCGSINPGLGFFLFFGCRFFIPQSRPLSWSPHQP